MTRSPWRATAAVLLVVSAIVGCEHTKPAPTYQPTASAARDAVTAALQAWSEGTTTTELAQRQHVQFADSRRNELALQRFNIVGEVPMPGARCFEAELQFADADESERVQYVVLGIDPLWVVRREEFEAFTHWDHNMAAPPPQSEDASVESESKAAVDDAQEPQSDSD